MRRFLVAAVVFGAVSSAQAADMPDFLRGGFTEGLSHVSVNWQGFYVGAQGSWGSQRSNVPGGLNSDMQSTFIVQPGGWPFRWPPLNMANQLNGGYGAFFGYNSQWEDVVLGIEGNYIHDGFAAKTTATGIVYDGDNVTVRTVTNSTATVKLPDFGSVRLRAGYMMGCFLPYGFVGAGMGEQTIIRTVAATPVPVAPAWMVDSNSKLVYGYTAGVGVDMQLIGGVFARAEYEYRRITTNIESNINTLRFGLGYKF